METAMKPMTAEAIAITEKKLSMTLDEIIKMSKKSSLKKKVASRSGVKSRSSVTAKYSKGALIQKNSNFREKHGALTSEVVRNSATTTFSQKHAIVKTRNESRSRCPLQKLEMVGAPSEETVGKIGWGTQKAKTMDARFANLKFRRPVQVQLLQPGPAISRRQTQVQQGRQGPRYGDLSSNFTKSRMLCNWLT